MVSIIDQQVYSLIKLEYEQGHLCSAFSPLYYNNFLTAQAAPSRGGNTALLPSHPTTLSYSFIVTSIQHKHVWHSWINHWKNMSKSQDDTRFHRDSHFLHLQGTSELSKTSAGISMQCRWYQTLQASHSAIWSTPTFSGNQQEQWSSVFWMHFIPEEFRSPSIGKRVNLLSSKHLAKWCLIDLWSNLTLHGSFSQQMSKAKAMARTPQSEPLDCCPTSIILTSSSDAGVNTRLAMSCIVFEETEGYMLS